MASSARTSMRRAAVANVGRCSSWTTSRRVRAAQETIHDRAQNETPVPCGTAIAPETIDLADPRAGDGGALE